MAGNYMDAPATRLAYDRDGAIGISASTAGVLTQLSAADLQMTNSETETVFSPPAATRSIAIVFPIPIDLRAVFLALGNTVAVEIATSKDTTTGLDGTWSTQIASATYDRAVAPNYRMTSQLTMFAAVSANLEVRGVRITGATANITALRAFHIYGDPASSATPDRIVAWHPTLNQQISPAYFDWGNVARSSSADRKFRLKNLSNNLSAADVDVYIEALTPGVPSVAGMHTLSDNDGASFLPGLVIPLLGPGEVSGQITLRRVVPSNAQVSVWSARVAADVGEWTEI